MSFEQSDGLEENATGSGHFRPLDELRKSSRKEESLHFETLQCQWGRVDYVIRRNIIGTACSDEWSAEGRSLRPTTPFRPGIRRRARYATYHHPPAPAHLHQEHTPNRASGETTMLFLSPYSSMRLSKRRRPVNNFPHWKSHLSLQVSLVGGRCSSLTQHFSVAFLLFSSSSSTNSNNRFVS